MDETTRFKTIKDRSLKLRRHKISIFSRASRFVFNFYRTQGCRGCRFENESHLIRIANSLVNFIIQLVVISFSEYLVAYRKNLEMRKACGKAHYLSEKVKMKEHTNRAFFSELARKRNVRERTRKAHVGHLRRCGRCSVCN